MACCVSWPGGARDKDGALATAVENGAACPCPPPDIVAAARRFKRQEETGARWHGPGKTWFIVLLSRAYSASASSRWSSTWSPGLRTHRRSPPRPPWPKRL